MQIKRKILLGKIMSIQLPNKKLYLCLTKNSIDEDAKMKRARVFDFRFLTKDELANS